MSNAQAKSVLIEDSVRFSQSVLWEAQRRYYDQQGVDAWAADVPFYVTSNPVIADKYAQVTARFFQDWLAQNRAEANSTFYIIELGAGTGQFGFYFLNRLRELLDRLQMTGVSFCYVMTDFTSQNITFWQQHPALAPYLKQGVLDFAVLDFENDRSLRLLNAQKELAEGSVIPPLTVIANYLFDSIVVDTFSVQQNLLSSAHVSVQAPTGERDSSVLWEQATFTYTQQPLSGPYYQDTEFNAVLEQYAPQIEKGYLHFPIGGLQGLKNLSRISQNQLLLLSSDKGYTTLDELQDLPPPDIQFHGSFSLMVNYHAIGEYCLKRHGDVFAQPPFDSFASGAFSIGFKFQDCPQTWAALHDNFGEFCPGHYLHFYEHFDQTVDDASLEYIASILRFTNWDPEIWDLSHERVSDLIDGADQDVISYIAHHLPQVAHNFYYIPGTNDTLFAIATFYQEIGDPEKAISYYTRSRGLFGEGYEVLLNLGDCYHELNRYREALDCLRAALSFNPADASALELVATVESAISMVSSSS